MWQERVKFPAKSLIGEVRSVMELRGRDVVVVNRVDA